jgi:hypothetical protein
MPRKTWILRHLQKKIGQFWARARRRSPKGTNYSMDPNKLRKLVELAGEHANAVLIGLRQPLMPSWVYIYY